MLRAALFLFVAMSACSDRTDAPIIPQAASVGTQQHVFVATNRVQDGEIFGIERAPDLRLLDVTVSIPSDRALGEISDGRASPNIGRDFALTHIEEFSSVDTFSKSLKTALRAVPQGASRDIVVYVHGFNNSFSDAAFRMAQLSHDLRIPGPVASFAWPSRGNPLGYEYDADSVLYSRDSLAEFLKVLKSAGPARLILVAHSMGSHLTLEALRQIELVDPGWSSRSLSGVLLVSPDIDIDVFRSQTRVFEHWPNPFVIFSADNDIFLRLSAGLRGRQERLGTLTDPAVLKDLPLTLIDVSALGDGSLGNHFIAGSSDSFLDLVRSSPEIEEAFLRGQTAAASSIFGRRRVVGRLVGYRLEPELQ